MCCDQSSWPSEPRAKIQGCRTASSFFSEPRGKGAVCFLWVGNDSGSQEWWLSMWGRARPKGVTSKMFWSVMSPSVASDKLFPLTVGILRKHSPSVGCGTECQHRSCVWNLVAPGKPGKLSRSSLFLRFQVVLLLCLCLEDLCSPICVKPNWCSPLWLPRFWLVF